ncbi:MAG: OmpA family protein [Saprospiraceae bacterium]|nr:OmpA family protein [Saprospiraceae bacterium]
MSAPIKVIVMLIIWALYSIVAYQGCLKQCCTEEGAGETTTVVDEPEETTPVASRYPIDFQWSSAQAFTNDGFDATKQNLLAQLDDNNILEITGFYFEGEEAPEGFENMGFARAAQIRDLLAPDIPSDRIKLRARLVDDRDGMEEGYFEAADFEWKTPEAEAEETVEELGDRAIIRFPFNSTIKEADAAVDDYLDRLAERIKTSGEKVTITGHTDNVGGDDANMALGLRRAKEIRDILIGKGVDRSQITTDSKGKSQPVDTNDTEAGRHNNRRAEVRLIKN